MKNNVIASISSYMWCWQAIERELRALHSISPYIFILCIYIESESERESPKHVISSCGVFAYGPAQHPPTMLQIDYYVNGRLLLWMQQHRKQEIKFANDWTSCSLLADVSALRTTDPFDFACSHFEIQFSKTALFFFADSLILPISSTLPIFFAPVRCDAAFDDEIYVIRYCPAIDMVVVHRKVANGARSIILLLLLIEQWPNGRAGEPERNEVQSCRVPSL